MKILLDECVTKRLKSHLAEFEVNTIHEMGWNGKKNGELVSLCTANQFEVLLTIDKNLGFQQNLKNYNIIVAVLNSKTSKLEELIKFLPAFKTRISGLKAPALLLVDLE
jgi:predicted nuclease of predicted toxin-antitoxin system